MKESELAAVVVEWLERNRWDVYQEVKVFGGRVADIVAIGPDGASWVIECKARASQSVIHQALKHVGSATWISVAIPALIRDEARRRFENQINGKLHGWISIQEWRNTRYYPGPLPQNEHIDPRLDVRQFVRPEYKRWAKAGSASGIQWPPYNQTREVLAVGRHVLPVDADLSGSVTIKRGRKVSK